jgi:hypothetical protein
MRMLAYHEGETPLVERTAGAFVAHSVSVGGFVNGTTCPIRYRFTDEPSHEEPTAKI